LLAIRRSCIAKYSLAIWRFCIGKCSLAIWRHPIAKKVTIELLAFIGLEGVNNDFSQVSFILVGTFLF
jgi:hypothetical protein